MQLVCGRKFVVAEIVSRVVRNPVVGVIIAGCWVLGAGCNGLVFIV